ncbi:MAG: carbohydrate ABC transporter permease [Spirochaetales bacterium]|nr:carbohydrate ABC transporter permease [Spirochaetales bacterium]
MKKIRFSHIIIYFVLTVGLIVIVYPVFLTVISSLKPRKEIIQSFLAFPENFYLGNFKEILSGGEFVTALYNSVFVTVGSLALIVTVIPMLAYSLERNSSRRSYKLAFTFVMVGIFIPFQVVMLPIVKIISGVHLMNKFGLILIYLGMSVPKMSFLYFGYMKSIPWELEEAAFIDGANLSTIFVRVIYPLLKPITVTVIILQGLWIWNDFMIPLIIVNRSAASWTLPLFQYNFKGQYDIEYNLIFTTFILAMLPMVVMYIFLQKYILKGLTEGSLKG